MEHADNVVNIFGAISKAPGSTDTTSSSLKVGEERTVNASGPVEDLAELVVDN
jgi:hypothetical protein